MTGDVADVLTTLAYDNALLTGRVELEVIERFGEGGGDVTDGEVGEFKVTCGRGELTGDKSGKPGDEDECGLPGELSYVKSIVIERFGEGGGDVTDGEVGRGELTGDKSGKPGEDECGLPGELSYVKSIVAVTTVAGHTTGTKWLGNQVDLEGPRRDHIMTIGVSMHFTPRRGMNALFKIRVTPSRMPFIAGYTEVISRWTTVHAACKDQLDENLPETHKSLQSSSYFGETIDRPSSP